MRRTLVVVGALTVVVVAMQPSGATFPGGNGKIAYFDFGQSPFQIHVIEPDGSAEAQLTAGQRSATDPTWSADGSRIAFVRDKPKGRRSALFIMNADGSGKTLIRRGVTQRRGEMAGPAWSPDGTQIVFCAFSNVNRAAPNLYVINQDGSGLNKISLGRNRFDCHPSWSPDGTRIAFVTLSRNGSQSLATMNPDGSDRTILVRRGQNQFPNWSPDGAQIVFTRQNPSQADVFVIDNDGSGRTRLTDTPRRYEWTPAFSPDGTLIAFSRGQGPNFLSPGDIFTMQTDGTDVVRVTDTRRGDEFRLNWQAV